MRYFASLCALMLAGSMPGFASDHSPSTSPQNQFHFQPSVRRAAQLAAHQSTAKPTLNVSKAHGPASKIAPQTAPSHLATAKYARRYTTNPPTGKVGFVAATDIPMGGGFNWNNRQVLPGDFNGDGKPDFTTIVENYNGTTWNYSVSIILSNGDGTFQPAILTAVANNDRCAQILVGDVNGDGKADVLVGHQPGSCGNSYTLPMVDVLLSNGDGTFTASSNTNNTINTSGLAGGTLADVNSDGKLDLVVVDDSNPAKVWTLLGNGDGTFQTPTSLALSGRAGNDVLIADLNGDGMLDIADLDSSSHELTVYLATSTPGYTAAAAYPTSNSVFDGCSLGLGDLTGDGEPELVSANCWDNTITVYVNNGDGSFQTGVYYSAVVHAGTAFAGDAYPEAVTIADVNGDGKNDIVSSNDDGGDVTILFGNGDGTVSIPTLGYAVGGYPQAPAIVGDFNGDGVADIVVADGEYSLAYLKGYGDGTFRAGHDYYSAVSTSNGYSTNVASGDFNGDGYADIAVANCCDVAMGVSVFLSNPDGSLQPAVNYGSDGSMYQVQVADVNGDGKLDLVASDLNGWVQIFTGNGDGSFTVGSTYSTDVVANTPVGLVIADFNKDGHPDLAVLNTGGQDVAILLNDGTGGFNAPVPYALSASLNQWQGQEMAAGDLGNGNPDLVIPMYNGQAVAVLMGNGDGTFQPEVDLTLPSGNPTGLTLADLNKDGKLDLAVTVYNATIGTGLYVALGNGDGTFQTPTPLATSLQDPNYDRPYNTFISTADIDGDSNPDLVYTNSEFGTVGVLFGQGNGSFYDPVEYPSGGYAWGLAVADVNGDGAPDVVIGPDDFAGASVLLNNKGSATLGSYTIGTSAQQATITAGQSATFTLTITPNNHYNGMITFNCPAGLPALATCTFQPAQVTLDGLTPVTVKLTITTAAPSAAMQIPDDIDPRENSHPRSAILLAGLNGVGVLGMVLASSFCKRRNGWSVLGLLVLGMSFMLVGCGGSSHSQTNTTKSNTSSAVTSSAATVLVGQPLTFTATVSATSGTPTGTVTFLDGSTTLGTGTLSNGTTSYQTSTLAAGVHSVTISYAGDSTFNASVSTALSQTVDNPGTVSGSYTVTVTGTGTAGSNGVVSPHQSINLSLTVQ